MIVLISGKIESKSKTEKGTAGICGNLRNGKITDCINEGDVETSINIAGGIAGTTSGDIFNSRNTGKITSNGNPSNQENTQGTGGIAGRVKSCIIQGCSNTENVKNEGYFSGGITGFMSDNATISQSYNYNACVECKLNGSGGIVGRSEGGLISDCYNNLSTNDYYIKSNGTNTAGILGISSSTATSSINISNCYSIGESVLKGTGEEYGIIIGKNSYAQTSLNNCPYLDTSSLRVVGVLSSALKTNNCISKTLNNFKSAVTNSSSVAYLLNGSNTSGLWSQSSSINGGYPYLVNNAP